MSRACRRGKRPEIGPCLSLGQGLARASTRPPPAPPPRPPYPATRAVRGGRLVRLRPPVPLAAPRDCFWCGLCAAGWGSRFPATLPIGKGTRIAFTEGGVDLGPHRGAARTRPIAGAGSAACGEPGIEIPRVVHHQTAEPYERRAVAGDALLFYSALRVGPRIRPRAGS